MHCSRLVLLNDTKCFEAIESLKCKFTIGKILLRLERHVLFFDFTGKWLNERRNSLFTQLEMKYRK